MILLRLMLPEERPMVLASWKSDLWAAKPAWGASLRSPEWWALVNHVIDTVSLPSADVWVLCHRDQPTIPLAWAAKREGKTLHAWCASSVRKDLELAAHLERKIHDHVPGEPLDWNPFLELRRTRTETP